MTLATVTGLSAWVLVGACVLLCLWAAWECRDIQNQWGQVGASIWQGKQELARLKAEMAREPDWNWPNRSHKNAPALVEQPRARQARR